MRKTLFKIVVFCSAFSLTACDFLASFINGGGEENNNNNNNQTPVAKVESVTIEDNKTYVIGDTYSTDNIVVTAHYDDNSTKTVPASSASINRIYNPLNQQITKSTQFEYVGEYRVDFRVQVDNKSLNTHINFDVASGFATAGFTLQSVDYVNAPSFHEGEVVKDRLTDLPLLIHWANHGTEHYNFNINTDTTGLSFRVKKEEDVINDYINTALENGCNYELILSYQTYTKTTAFTVGGNYYRLNSEDIVNIQTDLDSDISPSKGNVKMLVIPITLSGNYTDTWTSTKLSKIDGYYFGTDTTKMSLKMYYETASFGQMSISGTVTAPYVETSTSLTTDLIQADTSMTKLFTLISNAINYVKSNMSLDDYDLDDNGVIDNVHLITNFNTSQYTNPWSTPLWPHKYQTGNTSGTKASPVANVYSISAIDHVQDCVTAVHEQGHIFGLDDYYDYAQTDIDYVGYADMQSGNMFDWNSFSKFSVGWISPYVITGPTEITIQAASLNGDCLVIPANPETFNNSAFDEYFLIELFAPYGNNAVNYPYNGTYRGNTWEFYSQYIQDLGDYGVRMYHVNDQMYGYTSSGFVEYNSHITNGGYGIYRPTDNDAKDYEDRSYYFDDWANYKELAIIQRGGTDTFGSTSSGARHYLGSADLFHQGDVFTFSQYAKFLTKDNTVPTTMNNGETFPYKITFTAMSSTQVTVKIEYA